MVALGELGGDESGELFEESSDFLVLGWGDFEIS